MLFDRSHVWSEDFSEYTEAAPGAWLGQSHARAVTFVSPSGAVFGSEAAPLTVELLDGPPELSHEAASVGEFDLLLPSGELVIGRVRRRGWQDRCAAAARPVAGALEWLRRDAAEAREYSEQSEAAPRPDRYLLQLWPLRSPGPVVTLRGY
jgi:ribosomal protein L34E